MRRALNERDLRQFLVGDSLTRRDALTKLLALIRADERAKVLDGLSKSRAEASQKEQAR